MLTAKACQFVILPRISLLPMSTVLLNSVWGSVVRMLISWLLDVGFLVYVIESSEGNAMFTSFENEY
jgi:hypothetical protein